MKPKNKFPALFSVYFLIKKPVLNWSILGEDKVEKSQMWLYHLSMKVVGGVAQKWFTPCIRGEENIPETGSAILASNHLAVIDDAVIPITVKHRDVHFMGKMEYFVGKGVKGKLTRFFFTNVGVFPVDRSGGKGAESGLVTAKEVLEKGEIFGIHPEGTRSPDGKLYKGHTGVAKLAFETGSPVVPVALWGTNISQPIGVVFPHRFPVAVSYGRPIEVPKLRPEEITYEKLRDLTDEIMRKIMILSGQEYVDMYAQERKRQLQEEKLIEEEKLRDLPE